MSIYSGPATHTYITRILFLIYKEPESQIDVEREREREKGSLRKSEAGSNRERARESLLLSLSTPLPLPLILSICWCTYSRSDVLRFVESWGDDLSAEGKRAYGFCNDSTSTPWAKIRRIWTWARKGWVAPGSSLLARDRAYRHIVEYRSGSRLTQRGAFFVLRVSCRHVRY